MTVSEAVDSGDIEQLRALLDAGGDPNEPETEEYWPPLHAAAFANHVEAARLLLDAGADMYAPTGGGETPLLMAVQRGSLGVFRLLIGRGCRIDAARENVPWMLVSAAGYGHLEVVQWLLAQGISVDLTDRSGRTALIHAAVRDHLPMVEALLQAGANPNHVDNDTETVLMWAADHAGNALVLRALLEAGAEVNARNDFEGTALSWVMRHGDPEMAEVLLKAGAEIDATGAASLSRAAWKGFAPVVRLMLDYGADPTVTDEEGKTALDHAKERKHREIANLLRQAMADHELRATEQTYPPPRYPVGAHVRTLTGTPREGWIVLVEWHHKHGAYAYHIEVEGVSQPRKMVSGRYWEADLQAIEERPSSAS